MSDAALRELERAWRASSACADEVALLRARLRAGRVTGERIALAAHCGHPAALQLLEQEGPELPPVREVLAPLLPDGRQPRYPVQRRISTNEQWASHLQSWGPEAVVRGFLGFARSVQGDWRPGVGTGDLEGSLREVEDWVLCPCDDHAQRAIAGRITHEGRSWGHLGTRRQTRAGGLGELVAFATAGQEWPALFRCATALPAVRGWRETEEEVRARIGGELVPWALGHGDPVRERVARRA